MEIFKSGPQPLGNTPRGYYAGYLGYYPGYWGYYTGYWGYYTGYAWHEGHKRMVCETKSYKWYFPVCGLIDKTATNHHHMCHIVTYA